MFTNEKILSKCHDYKHDSKFWNLSRDKKNSSRREKKNASRVRETADQLSCQSMFQRRAFRWLPNIADVFFSLARLIEDSERQLNSASYDSLEFLFGALRMDENSFRISPLRVTSSQSFFTSHASTYMFLLIQNTFIFPRGTLSQEGLGRTQTSLK